MGCNEERCTEEFSTQENQIYRQRLEDINWSVMRDETAGLNNSYLTLTKNDGLSAFKDHMNLKHPLRT